MELDYVSAESNQESSPRFIREKLLQTQAKAWDALHIIRSQIQEGMTEHEARDLALTVFADHGFSKHWHQSYIRFGAGTTLTFHNRLQKDYRLQEHDPFYIDVGPVLRDAESALNYEADVGETFIFGENAEAQKCITATKNLFFEAQDAWRSCQLTGTEIYSWLARRATELGYSLIEKVEGHRLSDFPHQKYSKEHLGKLDFCPGSSLWVLEVHLKHPTLPLGAFYEDLLGDALPRQIL